MMFGEGFSVEERTNYRPVVFMNTLCAIQEVLRRVFESESSPDAKETTQGTQSRSAGHQMTPTELRYARSLLSLDCETQKVTPDIAKVVQALWKVSAVRNALLKPSSRHVPGRAFNLDAAGYLFNRIEAIGAKNYVPSEEDILRVRQPTTGIIEGVFHIRRAKFSLLDVGGQRSERKKWLHCFDGVACVLFVVSLSGFNEVLFEDRKVNRMDEALRLYEEVTNSEYFEHTPIALFLNKSDLFRSKIRVIPLTDCPVFSDFYGIANNYEQTTEAVVAAFRARNRKKTRDRMDTVHITCATDRSSISSVVLRVVESLMRSLVASSQGLV